MYETIANRINEASFTDFGRTRPAAAKRVQRFLASAMAGLVLGGSAPSLGAELVVQQAYSSDRSTNSGWLSSLVQLPDGSFYGTAPASGSRYYGSVFRLTRTGSLTTIVTFQGFNGNDPEGGLLKAADGNLYGTTMQGGTYNLGTIFRIYPAGGLQTLRSLGGTNGAWPMYSLIQTRDGFLYGVTRASGTNGQGPATVFKATTAGVVTTLTNLPAGAVPSDGLVEGPDGWLYGTTAITPVSGRLVGSIYKVSTNGEFRTLANFYDPSSPPWPSTGDRPIGGLVAGPDGPLYGTLGHNAPFPATNHGSVFSMTTNGALTTLFTFSGTNGDSPITRLLLANDGVLYGLTAHGGPSNQGTIFGLTTNGALTTFGSGFSFYSADGAAPALMQADNGAIYGTGYVPAAGGQAGGWSIVWRLVPPPVITDESLSNGRLTLTWTSFPYGRYQVARKGSLEETNWTAVGSIITTSGSEGTYSYWPAAAQQNFYRVTLVP